MEVGDYVRTKQGYIAKIEEEFDKSYLCDDTIEYTYEPLPFIPKDKPNEIIIKSSPRIIDLIEVGDYVNGMEVKRICFDEDGERILNLSNCILELMNEDIKSIITHEQFSQMEYRIGE